MEELGHLTGLIIRRHQFKSDPRYRGRPKDPHKRQRCKAGGYALWETVGLALPGLWRRPVAHLVRTEGARSSNLLSSTPVSAAWRVPPESLDSIGSLKAYGYPGNPP